jgi:uncharacterized membrane protein YkoI
MRSSLARLASLALFVPAIAFAKEKPVAKSAVPKAVSQGAKSAYPKGKILETVLEDEEGQKLYEVRIQDGTSRVDLKFDAAGKLMEQEHILDPKTAPAAVMNAALAPTRADWKVNKVEKVDNIEKPAESGYEVEIEKAGSKREVLLTKEGTVIKEEAEDDVK